MYEVVYNKEKKYLLTNEEFLKAMTSWNQGKSFFCLRINALLPRFISYAEEPREDMGYEVFILGTPDDYEKIYRKENKYYERVSYGGSGIYQYSWIPIKILKERIEKLKLKGLIPQEKFFQYYVSQQSPRSLSTGN